MIRRLDKEAEQLPPHRGEGRPIVGTAISANGLTSARIRASDELGYAQQEVIRQEFDLAKGRCAFADSCQLELVTPRSDDALPSEAIFHCPRLDDMCAETVLGVATTTSERAEAALRNMLSSVQMSDPAA